MMVEVFHEHKFYSLKYLLLLLIFAYHCSVFSATIYSNDHSFMGSGNLYGPGKTPDSMLFPFILRNVAFLSPMNFVIPFINNSDRKPIGIMSSLDIDANKNVNVSSFTLLKDEKVIPFIPHDGPLQGQVLATFTNDGELIMTMDLVFKMKIADNIIIKMPFYGTSAQLVIPLSLQSQLGLGGGEDSAGSLKAGNKIRGRIGDFNHDGMLDGTIVAVANIPLDSPIKPGAPYAMIRNFDSDIPYSGAVIGYLPNQKQKYDPLKIPMLTIIEPKTEE